MLANREIIARKIGTMRNVSLNEARKMVDNVLLAIEDLTKDGYKRFRLYPIMDYHIAESKPKKYHNVLTGQMEYAKVTRIVPSMTERYRKVVKESKDVSPKIF